jgi:hypothetical protein
MYKANPVDLDVLTAYPEIISMQTPTLWIKYYFLFEQQTFN